MEWRRKEVCDSINNIRINENSSFSDIDLEKELLLFLERVLEYGDVRIPCVTGGYVCR